MFSSESADLILDKLIEFAQKKQLGAKVAPNKYKLVLRHLNGESMDLEMNVKILKDGDKNCIEVNRIQGDCLGFYENFNILKEYLGDIVDETQ